MSESNANLTMQFKQQVAISKHLRILVYITTGHLVTLVTLGSLNL